MSEVLKIELRRMGRTMLDAVTLLEQAEHTRDMALKLLEEGAELKLSDDADDWRNRVNDFLMRV